MRPNLSNCNTLFTGVVEYPFSEPAESLGCGGQECALTKEVIPMHRAVWIYSPGLILTPRYARCHQAQLLEALPRMLADHALTTCLLVSYSSS